MPLLLSSLLLLVLSPACNRGDDGDGPGATVPEESTTTTTTAVDVPTTLDPASYAVPDVIDQAYVQRVVSAYDHVLGDAIRVLKRDGNLSDDFLKHLLAIYTEPEFQSQQSGWREAVRQGDLALRPQVPGDPVTAVVAVARADQKCITAEIDRDFRPTVSKGVEPAESPQADYVVLVRRRDRPDPLGVNPTPWIMAFDGFKNDGTIPVNSCDD